MGGHLHGWPRRSAQFLTEAFQREAKPKLADRRAFCKRASPTRLRARRLRQGAQPDRVAADHCVACVVQDSTAYGRRGRFAALPRSAGRIWRSPPPESSSPAILNHFERPGTDCEKRCLATAQYNSSPAPARAVSSKRTGRSLCPSRHELLHPRFRRGQFHIRFAINGRAMLVREILFS